jgi:3-methyladenine DNA glycosylase AlkD
MGLALNVEQLYSEIVGELEKRADPRLIEKEMYYHKKVGASFKAYGIGADQFYEMLKKYRPIFKQLSFEERMILSKRFFESGYGVQMSFGIALLKLNVKDMTPRDFGVLEMASDCLNNWGTVDGYCIEVLQPLLFKYPREMLQLLRRWNSAESLWKRRASVVVFTRRVGKSGRFTNEALKLCDALIWDGEDYVRKGVGWSLKDTMRGDKKKVLEYVNALRLKGVSSVITLYAIRDLKGPERKALLNLRTRNSHA